jgi:hypothetical protein
MPSVQKFVALNTSLAKALGLPVENLLAFSLQCKANSIPIVTAEYLVLGDEGLKSVVEAYELRLVDTDVVDSAQKRGAACP